MTTNADILALMERLCAGTAVTFALTEVSPPDDVATLSKLAIRHLTPTEQCLLSNLRSSKRRAEFCAGRIAAKLAIAASPFCFSSTNPEIGRTPLGAPFVLGSQRSIHLSISHSATFAVAVVAGYPVGVDLERDEERPESFARLFLTQAERDEVRRMSSPARQTLINHFWCRKEAACKLGGWGATLPFASLDTSRPEATVEGRTLCLVSCASAGYVASLAVQYPQPMAPSYASCLGGSVHG